MIVESRDILTQVVNRDGRVLMLFSRRTDDGVLTGAVTDNLSLEPDAALIAAELLSRNAFEADTKLKPVGDTLKEELVRKHREKLKPVIETILRTKINAKERLSKMSVAILDEVCKEIF